jgi:hypothetical protein
MAGGTLVHARRESPYEQPLDRPVTVYYTDPADGQRKAYGTCRTPNDVLNARLDLGLRRITTVEAVATPITNMTPAKRAS